MKLAIARVFHVATWNSNHFPSWRGPMKTVTVLVVMLMLTAVSFAKRKPAVTISVHAAPEKVKAAAVAQAVSEGWMIESEGQFQIVFTKPMNAVGGIFTASLLSPSACSGIRPRYLFTLLFVPIADGVNLTTHKEMEHADGFCHPARDNWDDQNRKYAESFLGKIKSASEGASTAPTAPNNTAVEPATTAAKTPNGRQPSSTSASTEAKGAPQPQHVVGECIQTTTGGCQK
jgi:hypothetical protein